MVIREEVAGATAKDREEEEEEEEGTVEEEEDRDTKFLSASMSYRYNSNISCEYVSFSDMFFSSPTFDFVLLVRTFLHTVLLHVSLHSVQLV